MRHALNRKVMEGDRADAAAGDERAGEVLR